MSNQLKRMSAGSFGTSADDGVPDMTVISSLDETKINRNLKARYIRDTIYTYTGSILIAINPYKQMDIYGSAHVSRYSGQKVGSREPHVYAIAEAAYSSLKQQNMNQSVVISGESGAGKTESKKLILQYLCSVTSQLTSWMEHQIMEANTILEAFGNAKTVRNDNSSRFGKFIRLCFDKKLVINGCKIETYLLEQSRITFQNVGEKNYHIFYQLVAAGQANKDIADRFYLLPLNEYKYLIQGESRPDKKDLSRFEALQVAFSIFQIPQDYVNGIFSTLSAILLLGNLEFEDVDGETTQLSSCDQKLVENVANLLFIDKTKLTDLLLRRQINVCGNVTEIPLKYPEAVENRHAMSKALYSNTFYWLINHINRCTAPKTSSGLYVGVLDIFGFENFSVNSFEQLCINYANEKLHKFFNHYVFALELETYRQEEIKFAQIQFADNTPCLELVEKPPRCILKLLTEQCHMPKGSDTAYVTNLHSEFGSHPNYLKGEDRRKWESEFGILHYAGPVVYSAKGFVDKNRDVQQDALFHLLSESSHNFVSDLAVIQESPPSTISGRSTLTNSGSTSTLGTISRGTNKGKPTVADTFRIQLQNLIDSLQATNPWYIRCIKPNLQKKEDCFDDDLVLCQLRYLGMLDIVRIKKDGFPVHMPFADFLIHYRPLIRHKRLRLAKEPKEACRGVLNMMNFPIKQWQVGKTKIFLKSQVAEALEEQKVILLQLMALRIQTWYRGRTRRKEYLRIRNAALCIQHAVRGWQQRIDFIRMRRAAIVIQAHLRGFFAREVAEALREMRAVEEEAARKEKLEQERRKAEEERAKNEASSGELMESERKPTGLDPVRKKGAVRNELEALSQIAEQLNAKLAVSILRRGASELEGPRSASADSVDLDKLFEFLTEVQSDSKANLLQEIEDQMNELAEDLKNEISLSTNVPSSAQIQTTPVPRRSWVVPSESMYSNIPPPESISEAPISPPDSLPTDDDIESFDQSEMARMPSPLPPSPLPSDEDHMPPPPPEAYTPGVAGLHLHQPTLPEPTEKPPPPPVERHKIEKAEEPIYESVKPRIYENHEERIRRESGNLPPGAKSPRVQKLSESRGDSYVPPMSPARSDRSDSESADRKARRRLRVEKRLQELEEEEQPDENVYYDFIEFAERYFNNHERSPEGTIMSTLSRKKKDFDFLPKYEMVSYYKGSSIPNSHIHMYDPESVQVACTIFKDLCKFIRGELRPEGEIQVIQNIIGYGIEREELRDETFCQQMRQATSNPNTESLERLWLLLALTCVSFQPSRILSKYFESFLKKHLQYESSYHAYVLWCYENVRTARASTRKLPPSTVEIAAVRRLGSIVCRFFLLDNRTKAVDVQAGDTGADALRKLADRLGLQSTDGWALYEARPDGYSHIKSHDYIYDIIASWELKQKLASPVMTLKRNSAQIGVGDNRFVFRRRLFRGIREVPQDPVEVGLMYAQAVYSVVKCDDFPINDKVALQLAGLQLQVALGEPRPGHSENYADVESFLSQRIARIQNVDEWMPALAQAHRQYGSGKTELVAKVWYLSCVMHFPLYGTTQFHVTYRGYWSYGNSIILGVNSDGIALIKPDDKYVLYEYRYTDIESVLLDPSDNFVTINLARTLPDSQKCFVFETDQKEEIGSLIASYYPALACWITESERPTKRMKPLTHEDRMRNHQTVVNCRRTIVESNILRKPDENGHGFISTLRRLNRQRSSTKLRQDLISDQSTNTGLGENFKGFSHSFWAFTKSQLTQSLTKLPDHDEKLGLQVFSTILVFSGLIQGENGRSADGDLVPLAQSIIERSLRKETFLTELFLQLIKQTTDHPEPNSRVNLRHWSLLALACSVALPGAKPVRKYLAAHLRRCASDHITEEGKFARFAERCFSRTMSTRRRQWPPSSQEVICTLHRRPVYIRVHLMDGRFLAVEFEPSASAKEVLEMVQTKLGLRPTARGYTLYEVFGEMERSLTAEEKLADTLAKWERYRNVRVSDQSSMYQRSSDTKLSNGISSPIQPGAEGPVHLLLFKKHLFVDQFMDMDDPVEKELLYHQMLQAIRTDRFPLTDMEAVMVCALRTQVEFGDFNGQLDYEGVIGQSLPRRRLPTVPIEAVMMHHQSLFGMTPLEAKQALLTIVQSWPLNKATFFDVTQSFTSNWPKSLWLAVDHRGLHFLEYRTRNILCHHDYKNVLSFSPTLSCLMVVTGSESKPAKIVLNTSQAFQIANLVREYCEILQPNGVVLLNGHPAFDSDSGSVRGSVSAGSTS
ncbi:myosin-I heavy chain-like isoform X3 [Artemia franciscana]|uniref:Uncharacterized protein n=1 Tax=Artemia franciscana TaxID=6661 RepID=A0AA88HSP7_ARTSF|nr:hypothetical protein QYM36_013725 [Artemia franciscana]